MDDRVSGENARYNDLRNRSAAERNAYHCGAWNRDGRWSVMDRDTNLIGGRVQLMNGRSVGTDTDTSCGRGGSVTALLVRLDNNRTVWIDASDVRYNRVDRVIMTNQDRGDLRL